MAKVSGLKTRVKQLHRMDNLKEVTKALAKGDVVEIKDYITHTSEFTDADGEEVKRVADYLEVTARGVDYRLPVNEYTKYVLEGEAPAYKSEGEKCGFPKSFTIASASDRKLDTDDGITLYPFRAYKKELTDKVRANEMTWVEMVSADDAVKADNKLAPSQNYSIECQY